ncbi:MAG: ferric reductase-like transmembrane domain-containing protein [Actinomycetes bacterium]
MNSQAFWFFSRGTGVVSLVLFTATVLLGITSISRWTSPNWPRFVTQHLHRNVSLLALSFLLIHIVSTVLDSYVTINLVNAVVPFSGNYRPIWLGLGALAFDLLLAIIITSLVRVRLGHKPWRAIHWLSYAMWPLAVVHGLGTGSDAKARWMLLVTGACVAAVAIALARRVAIGWTDEMSSGQRTVRILAAAATVLGPLALAGWLITGPLTSGWGHAAAATPKSAAAAVVPGTTAAQTGIASSAEEPGNETGSEAGTGDK